MNEDIKALIAEGVKEGLASHKPKAEETIEGAAGAGFLDKMIPKVEVLGVNLSDAAKGAAVAGLGDALAGVADSLLTPKPTATDPTPKSPVPSWALKMGMAYAVQTKLVKGFVGPNSANLGALFLAYDAVQEFFNIRRSVSNLVSGIIGPIVKRSPAVALGAGAVRAVPVSNIATPASISTQTSSEILRRIGVN